MVLSEICTRDFPFAEVELEKVDILKLICGQKEDAVLKVTFNIINFPASFFLFYKILQKKY